MCALLFDKLSLLCCGEVLSGNLLFLFDDENTPETSVPDP
jgi:hypothetical protein